VKERKKKTKIRMIVELFKKNIEKGKKSLAIIRAFNKK
jgi:hypothetical protein